MTTNDNSSLNEFSLQENKPSKFCNKMSNGKLRSLNWGLLNKTSDNDSDETECEEEVDVDAVISKNKVSGKWIAADNANGGTQTVYEIVENGTGKNENASITSKSDCLKCKVTNTAESSGNAVSNTSTSIPGFTDGRNFSSNTAERTLGTNTLINSESNRYSVFNKNQTQKDSESIRAFRDKYLHCFNNTTESTFGFTDLNFNDCTGVSQSTFGFEVAPLVDSDSNIFGNREEKNLIYAGPENEIQCDIVHDVRNVNYSHPNDRKMPNEFTKELNINGIGDETKLSTINAKKDGLTDSLENIVIELCNKELGELRDTQREILCLDIALELIEYSIQNSVTEGNIENLSGGQINSVIEERLENLTNGRKRVCVPPLTLIDRSNKKLIVSEKKLKRRKRKKRKDKETVEKILPVRMCQSKFIDQTKRSTNLEESLEAKSYCTNKSNRTKTTGTRFGRSKTYKENKTNEHCKIKVRKMFKRKSRIKRQKLFTENESSQSEKASKVPFLQKLKEIDLTLQQVEGNTHKWVNGDEHVVTRETAFEMLEETQGIAKTLGSLQVPRRGRVKLTKIKNKLCERATKLALAIDAAITECDQMFNQECHQRSLDEKSISSDEETLEITFVHKFNMVRDTESSVSKHSTESLFGHNCCQKKNRMQGSTEIEKSNAHVSSPKVEQEGINLQRSTSEVVQKQHIKNKIPVTQQFIANKKPKSILKYLKKNDSVQAHVSHGKHISFSNEIEIQTLSGTTSSTLLSSNEIPTQSVSTVETGSSSVKTDAAENKTQRVLRDSKNSNSIYNENKLKLKEVQKIDEASEKLEKPSLNLHEKLNCESKLKIFNAGESLITRQEEPVNVAFQTSVSILNDVPTQLREQTNHDIENGETKGNNRMESNGDKGCGEDNPTSLPCSEGSAPVSFGFSEEPFKTNQPIWKDVSINDIKHIRIKTPGEFTPAGQDGNTWHDLDKW